MATGETPLRICGWMQFKHLETNERKSSPAIAIFRERPVTYGEKTRMAIEMRSPFTDDVGTWDEVSHQARAKGSVEEAKKWSLVEFTPNDPSVKSLLTERVEAMLRENLREAGKKRSADRRVTACRFDEWVKGWSVDLVWDPFKDLDQSALALLKLANQGAMHVDEEHVEHWLDQPVTVIPAKRSSYGAYAAKPAAGSAPAPAPRAAAPARAEASAPTTSAARPQASGSNQEDIPMAEQDSADAAGFDAANYEAANLEPIDLPDEPSSLAEYPVEQDIPFGDEPAAALATLAPAKQAEAARAPTPQAESPAAEPVRNEPDPAPAASLRETATERAHSPAEAAEDLTPQQALERDIFSGPELPSFSSIARANGTTLQRPQPQNGAEERPDSGARGAHEGDSGPARAPKILRFAFARFPSHGDDGSIAWDSALLHCQGYMEPEAFNASKRHRVATRAGAQGRQESLYRVDVLADMAKQGIAFELEGHPLAERHMRPGAEGPTLDVQNFALSTLAKSGFGPASNIAALARVKFYRDKAMEIISTAPREAAAEAPDQGWIQISHGQERPDATRYHAASGSLRWWKSGASAPLIAKIADPEARAKLARHCEGLAAAFQTCHPASAEPDGPLAPGGAPVEPLERRPAFGARR